MDLNVTLPEELLKSLQTQARQRVYREIDDWYPVDAGNYDDAFEAGESDGATYMAREVLDALGIPYTVKGDHDD